MHDIATKPDLEAIMQRLRGKQEVRRPPAAVVREMEAPPKHEVVRELKQVAQLLAAKLKEALTDKQSLQEVLGEREGRLACVQKDQETLQAKVESLEQELLSERTTRAREIPEASSQVLKMAMTCRELEDEIHALTCEKAATLRQFREMKEWYNASKLIGESLGEQLKTKENSLTASESRVLEAESKIERLQGAYDRIAEENATLQIEAENSREELQKLESQEASLRIQLSTVNEEAAVLGQQQIGLKNDILQLQAKIDELNRECAQANDDKGQALRQVQEVEAVLVHKLSLITELQEQVGMLTVTIDDLHRGNEDLRQEVERTCGQLQSLETEKGALLEAMAQTRQLLSGAEENNLLLTQRTERYECLEQLIKTAKVQVLSLLKALENEEIQPVTVAKLVEELSIQSDEVAGRLVEEHFEQHDLF